MKQYLGPCLLVLVVSIAQVQGGIITNQQSLTLPAELADAIASSSSTSTSSSSSSSSSSSTSSANANATDSDSKASRSGRVIYTASYSNVRISSKEPKNLKYFPIPAVISKKTVNPAANIVPIMPKYTTSTTTTTTAATTTSTTSSTTTTPKPEPEEDEPLPQEVPSDKDLASLVQVEQTLPDIIEIMEEIEPGQNDDDGNEEEVVTEMVKDEVLPDTATATVVTDSDVE